MSDQRFEQIWAPWRLGYVSGEEAKTGGGTKPAWLKLLRGGDPDCFLCCGVVDTRDDVNLVIERSEHAFVVLNRFPYTNGHLLVAPQIHKPRLIDLNEVEQFDIQRLITKYIALLERLVKAEGFNVGLNLGRAAGAGVPGHLHWHIVPRWSGDTNFMPSLAGTRVIPQSLDALWDLLREAITS